MKLRNIRERKQPALNVIPMIDIMFFLLVFFMMSTMYMIDLKTIPVKLPQAASAAADTTATFAVTLKKDGSIYIGDKKTTYGVLVQTATVEQKNNPSFAVIVRADEDVEYRKVIALIDGLKKSGVTRFGLATDNGK